MRDELDEMLKYLYDNKGSDLHLQVREYPIARLAGKLVKLENFPKMSAHVMEEIVNDAYRSNVGSSTLNSLQDLDFAYDPAVDGKFSHEARYRVNASQDRKGVRIVFRRLPSLPPTAVELSLPENCTRLINSLEKGLVLVTGPTGSGKSTTLASYIRNLLEEHDNPRHILTLEDPIEFIYDKIDKGASIITQREKLVSLRDFKMGLHSGLRQDPDVILVGEMRDAETISLALEAAETGHLVFGTLHTSSVASTLSRIVQVFPYQEQENIRAQLVSSIRLIICQMLYSKKGGGRVAAREHLIFDPIDRDEVLKLNGMNEVLLKVQSLVSERGVTMEKSVVDLLKSDSITEETFDDIMRSIQSPLRSHTALQ